MKYKKTSNDGVEALVHTYIHRVTACHSPLVFPMVEKRSSRKRIFSRPIYPLSVRGGSYSRKLSHALFSLSPQSLGHSHITYLGRLVYLIHLLSSPLYLLSTDMMFVALSHFFFQVPLASFFNPLPSGSPSKFLVDRYTSRVLTYLRTYKQTSLFSVILV
jgi:hypothetical protein